MEGSVSIDRVYSLMDKLKENYYLIQEYEAAKENRSIIEELDDDKKHHNIDFCLLHINTYLKSLGMKQINSMSELDDLIIELRAKYLATLDLIENGNNNNAGEIQKCQTRINELSGIYDDIMYYTNIDNFRKILETFKQKNEIVYFNRNNGIFKELIKIKNELSSILEPSDYQIISSYFSQFNDDETLKYTSEDELQMVNVLKDAVSTISDEKIRHKYNFALSILIKRHDNNYNMLSRVQIQSSDDVGNRCLDVNKLISVISSEDSKSAIKKLYEKNLWATRKNLTINEIIQTIEHECTGKEKFIDSVYVGDVKAQIDSYNEKIEILKSADRTTDTTDLSRQQIWLSSLMDMVTKWLFLMKLNNEKVKNAKHESDLIIQELNGYIFSLSNNVIKDVNMKIDGLDSYQSNMDLIREKASSINDDYRLDKLSDEKAFKIFSDYYLDTAIKAYIEGLRAYFNLPFKIQVAINNYNYREANTKELVPQLSDDIDNFFDLMLSSMIGRKKTVLSNKKAFERSIESVKPKNSSFKLSYLTPKFNLDREFDKMKLCRLYFAKRIEGKITNPTFSSSDLVSFGRSEEELRASSDELAQYFDIQDRDTVTSILGK